MGISPAFLSVAFSSYPFIVALLSETLPALATILCCRLPIQQSADSRSAQLHSRIPSLLAALLLENLSPGVSSNIAVLICRWVPLLFVLLRWLSLSLLPSILVNSPISSSQQSASDLRSYQPVLGIIFVSSSWRSDLHSPLLKITNCCSVSTFTLTTTY